jgi:Optic atrophy 3 protein (OPA3)
MWVAMGCSRGWPSVPWCGRRPILSDCAADRPREPRNMALLLKFGVLFMRSVAKPVSNMVKSAVKDHAAFRALAVGGARLHARTNARWDRVVRRRPVTDKKGNPIVRRELTENEAIDLAADIIGEAFLLYVY